MERLFEHTVAALCHDIAQTQTSASAPYDDVTEFVLGQWRRMPRFLAWPMKAATLLFAYWTLPRGGLYPNLPPQRRILAVEAWRISSLGAFRDVMRFYRSLVLMAAYSRELAEQVPETQNREAYAIEQ